MAELFGLQVLKKPSAYGTSQACSLLAWQSYDQCKWGSKGGIRQSSCAMLQGLLITSRFWSPGILQAYCPEITLPVTPGEETRFRLFFHGCYCKGVIWRAWHCTGVASDLQFSLPDVCVRWEGPSLLLWLELAFLKTHNLNKLVM